MFFWTDLINVHKHVDSTSYGMTTAVCNTHDSVYMINLHKQFTPFLPHAMLRLRLSKDTHTHIHNPPQNSGGGRFGAQVSVKMMAHGESRCRDEPNYCKEPLAGVSARLRGLPSSFCRLPSLNSS